MRKKDCVIMRDKEIRGIGGSSESGPGMIEYRDEYSVI